MDEETYLDNATDRSCFFALYAGTTPAVILLGDDSSFGTVEQLELAAGIGVNTRFKHHFSNSRGN
ncbi:hypothetical protein GCM10026983_28440 [Gracilibacillus alcaliphilus]